MTIEYRPTALSYSASSTYKGCPKKWAYTYIWRRELVTTSYPTTLGKFVHEVFERFYEFDPADRTLKNLRTQATATFETFRETEDFVLLFLTDDLVSLFKHHAWDNLVSIYDFEDPQDIDVVSVEMNFEGVMLKGTKEPVPFKGQVDRVDVTSTGYIVTDYKTGNMPEVQYMYQKTPQIYLYSAVIKQTYGELPQLARFMFMQNGIWETEPTQKAVDKHIDKLSEIWEQIHNSCETEEFPAKPTMLCGWCPHVDLCEEGQKKVEYLVRIGKMKPTAPAIEMLDLHYLVR